MVSPAPARRMLLRLPCGDVCAVFARQVHEILATGAFQLWRFCRTASFRTWFAKSRQRAGV